MLDNCKHTINYTYFDAIFFFDEVTSSVTFMNPIIIFNIEHSKFHGTSENAIGWIHTIVVVINIQIIIISNVMLTQGR